MQQHPMNPEQISAVFQKAGHEVPDARSLKTMSRWLATFDRLESALRYEPVKGDTLIPRLKSAIATAR